MKFSNKFVMSCNYMEEIMRKFDERGKNEELFNFSIILLVYIFLNKFLN